MNKKQKKIALKALQNLRLRLLDLTARNRLINFRHTKTGSLRIIDALPDQLVATLLSETEMRFLPVSEPTREELVNSGHIEIDEDTGQEISLQKDPSAEEWAKQLGLNTSYEVPSPETGTTGVQHAPAAMQTLLYPYELESRLKSLTRVSESAIQEMGANILYMGFGFLEWFENASDNSRIAPLFLVPTRLKKGRLNPQTRTYEYALKYSGEDIIANLSLREKLRADFAMALPALDESTNPEAYFEEVVELIKANQPRWRLRRFITLTLLNFSKLLMYLDLDPSHWPKDANIVDHSLVGRFLIGCDADQNQGEPNGSFEFWEEHSIDDLEDVHAKYPLIYDADSSQHSALIDAVDGKDLVIEGPPGTGKSQSITNLIAAAMARGKKVLFVAEKLAALQVVRRRFDAAGLGQFCLELHSHKSQKRKMLDEIEARMNNHGRFRMPKDIELDIVRYEELKKSLKDYVERINQPWKNTGQTLHDIFMAAVRYRKEIGANPEVLHPENYDGDSLGRDVQRRMADQLDAFCKIYQAVTDQLDDASTLQQHPWHGVRNSDLQIFDSDRVQAALNNWQQSLQLLSEERSKIAEVLDCGRSAIADSLNEISLLLNDLEGLPSLKGNEILDLLPALQGAVLDEAHQCITLFEEIQSLYADLQMQVGVEVLQDLSVVDSFLDGSEQLAQLVGPMVELGALAETINRLTAMRDQLTDLEEPLQTIQDIVGENAAAHLLPTEAGLLEFRVFVDLVSGLHPSYWKLRDERFDNEEMDELLPSLRNELNRLHALRDELSSVFRLDSLPEHSELRRIREDIDAGGFFRWCNSSWRSARKEALNLAEDKSIRLARLRSLIEKAEDFLAMRRKFEENNHYKEVFGDYMKGLETDLKTLESLREWYKSVRRQYGLGFGPKVALGNAIIELPTEIARAVRSLSEQGVQKQLTDLLDDLETLKKIFSPVSELTNITTLLAGQEGMISRLLTSVNDALLSCRPLAIDKAMSMADLADRIERLDLLKKAVGKWEAADYNNRLFQGRVYLTLGVYADNDNFLSVMRNTLKVAGYTDRQLHNDQVRQCIYARPESPTFDNLKDVSSDLGKQMEIQETRCKDFCRLVALDLDDWMKASGDRLESLIERNNRALQSSESLQNWLDYARVRDQTETMGLGKLATAIEQADIKIDQSDTAFKAGLFDLLSREILREQPELGRFSGRNQEALQKQYRQYDNQLKKLQCEKIAWQIDQVSIPKGACHGPVSNYSELCLIEHECSKKKRHIPIRQLLHRAGGALAALKPCFMMGPMSVAQYLAPGNIEFDLIVMDEASQIKPQDALGSIARGEQLVVVGDPKQLPPTSFFERVIDDNEEDPTTIEESESILDATLPMFPIRRLRWHYRSQHESLIAFSNHSFYDGNLVLFPSPYKKTDAYGVRYERIQNGCFVNRRNREEAKVIAEAVREHFRLRTKESLGVAAMSAEQRLQIESAIEILAKEDSMFQEWLEEDGRRDDPLFIKNLENVQGDERDVIFISMTYGPKEPNGKVFQRFGPINSEVGWRRLNVLFTRAKKRMHVFSSMGSEDIVADSSTKRGVKALRDFLAYCETGILHTNEQETARLPDSDFEIAVMAALQDKGFECLSQVGVAGFFIDIAVLDPGNPGRYLMGIECDGATYHSAKSTRDRDRLRQKILERLGWRIRRIWSTDWFKNPHAELQPIIRELNSLKTKRVKKVEKKIEAKHKR